MNNGKNPSVLSASEALYEPRMNNGIGFGYPLINKERLKVVFWV